MLLLLIKHAAAFLSRASHGVLQVEASLLAAVQLQVRLALLCVPCQAYHNCLHSLHPMSFLCLSRSLRLQEERHLHQALGLAPQQQLAALQQGAPPRGFSPSEAAPGAAFPSEVRGGFMAALQQTSSTNACCTC